MPHAILTENEKQAFLYVGEQYNRNIQQLQTMIRGMTPETKGKLHEKGLDVDAGFAELSAFVAPSEPTPEDNNQLAVDMLKANTLIGSITSKL